MKKKVITVAMFALLGTLAVGCQKENIIPETLTATDTVSRYIVKYSVDGVIGQSQFETEEERTAFLHSLFALAREGHVVHLFGDNTATASLTKETVTYRTRSESDAIAWSNMMTKDGYDVTISFDDGTGEFVCIAYRP